MKKNILSSVSVVKVGCSDEDIIRRIAKLYCEIWKEPPWFEFNWKEEEVFEKVLSHTQDFSTIVIVALLGRKVVGFSWGRCVNKAQLLEISSGSCLDLIFGGRQQAFYVNELAIDIKFRSHGIAKRLALFLVKEAQNSNFGNICLRTDKNAVIAQNLYASLGFVDTNICDNKHKTRTYWFLG